MQEGSVDGRGSRRLAWGALAVGMGAYAAYLVLRPGTAWSVTATNDVAQTLVALAAAVSLFVAARRSAGRQRTSWHLLAGACLSWGLGQLVWTWFELVRHEQVPYPGPPDVGYLGLVPLLIAAVLLFPSASLRRMGRARAALDGLIATAAALFASYGTFLGVVYAESEGTFAERAIAMTYPAADVVTVSIVLAVLARRSRRLDGPLPLVAAGVLALAVADSAFAYFTASSTYGNDPLSDLGWPLGFALFGLAPWLPRRSTLRASGEAVLERRTVTSGASLLLPYLPLVPALAVFCVRVVSGQPLGAFLGAVASVIAVLLVARQVVTLFENRELTRDLESTVLELLDREDQLQFQAFHDPLTALANRALFRDRLDHALAQRRDDPVSVLFLDLDDFKTVNDSLGHDAGDQLLVAVGERLRACVRAGDTVARLGGDEFAILLEGDRGATEGPLLAQRVLTAMEVPFSVHGHELQVGASLGLASGSYQTGEAVLQDADLAMYAAKANGKARLELYQSGMCTTAVDSLELVAELKQAVGAGQLRVHFQPVVDLASLRVEGQEALVRWEHPTRGLLEPSTFVPIAEETGEILGIGWWVLERACEAAVHWPGGRVGVNLSARQVLDPGAVMTVARVLARTGIDPSRVVLEISETVLRDIDAMGDRLHQLRALGVRLAIDDFGTGYSSLSYLTRFPVDIVKIDHSFVRRLGGPPGDEALVKAVVQVARSLGLRSVAEGVETPAQLERLQSFGCDAAQGSLFGEPLAEPQHGLGSLRRLPRVARPA